MLTLEEFNRRFKIKPTSLLELPKDLSDIPPGQPVEGDCQDYARTVRKILGLNLREAVMWRCWSKQNGLIPRHAVLWVKGKGWIDSTTRRFRPTPEPCTRLWPVGTPAALVALNFFGAWMGWWPLLWWL